MKIYKYLVTRPKDTVEVLLMQNKLDPHEFQYINLTKGHICPCKFSSLEDAIADMDRLKLEGKIINYEEKLCLTI